MKEKKEQDPKKKKESGRKFYQKKKPRKRREREENIMCTCLSTSNTSIHGTKHKIKIRENNMKRKCNSKDTFKKRYQISQESRHKRSITVQ